MVLISKTGSFYTWQDVCSYYFVYSYKIHNSFSYKNGTEKIAGKYPEWEPET